MPINAESLGYAVGRLPLRSSPDDLMPQVNAKLRPSRF
jgi:hypothetical protein